MFDGKRATGYLDTITKAEVDRYVPAWSYLIPSSRLAVFHRWTFAIMSVRTRWQENVKGFLACKRLPDPFTLQELDDAVRGTGLGLYDQRIAGVWQLHEDYRARPGWYKTLPGESMIAARDRLAKYVTGLGMAKTAFVFEMLYPLTCQVVCIDTHMLQLYGYRTAPGDRVYRDVEAHWVRECSNRGVPSPIARHIYWDRLQGHPDSMYWAWCLKEPHEHAA